MEELKCKKCGGTLEIDEDKEFGTCQYCKTKYKISENQKIVFSMDDNTKETIENRNETVRKMSLVMVIPFLLTFILIIGIAIYIISSAIKMQSSSKQKMNSMDSTISDIYNDAITMQKQITQ